MLDDSIKSSEDIEKYLGISTPVSYTHLAITVEDEFKIRFSSDAKLETVKDIVDYVEANAK